MQSLCQLDHTFHCDPYDGTSLVISVMVDQNLVLGTADKERETLEFSENRKISTPVIYTVCIYGRIVHFSCTSNTICY